MGTGGGRGCPSHGQRRCGLVCRCFSRGRRGAEVGGGDKNPDPVDRSNPPEQAAAVIKYNLTQTIFSREIAEALSCEAVKHHAEESVHIKIDTGMGGVWV